MTHHVGNRIETDPPDIGEVSDGYHTFDELYEHRIELFLALCRQLADVDCVWRSLHHSDGTMFDGWFIMGIRTAPGYQITYHLPMSRWADTHFATDFNLAPKWDGHTSADVIQRLKAL